MVAKKYPSEDGLAVVAVHLALKSQYLTEHKDLSEAFWHFYEVLLLGRDIRIERDEDKERQGLEGVARGAAAQERSRAWQATPGFKLVSDDILRLRAKHAEHNPQRRQAGVFNYLLRANLRGDIQVPIGQLSSAELRKISGIGAKSALFLEELLVSEAS